MKRAKKTDLIIPYLLTLLLMVALPGSGVAQTTAFTYQGKLTDSGNPANGNYDLQFKLFDALSGGTQQGTTLSQANVAVSGGIFNVTLDFGANVFTAAARFLEIAVRPAGNPNPHTILAPRQPITSSPYAIQTLNAQQLGGLPASRYVTADPSGNVGIGVANPDAKLAVTTLTNGAGNNTAYFSAPNIGPNASNIHYGTTGDWYIRSASSLGKVILQDTGGNVGIGTPNPTSKVEIAAQDGLAITGVQPFMTLRDTNSGGLRSILAGGNGDFGFYPHSFIGGSPAMILKNSSGNLGIGTANPTSKLEIAAQDGLAITGFQPFLTLRDTNSGGLRSLLAGGSGDFGFYPNSFIGGTPAVIVKNGTGNVGIGVSSPAAKLQVAAGNLPGISVTSQGNAVIGLSSSAGFAAVYGENTSGAGGYGVYGKGTTGDAMYAEGNARQSRDKGGFVKAMISVGFSGAIARCYNGVTGSSSGNCGFVITHFAAGGYGINFGFQVSDRFVSVTPEGVGGFNLGAFFSFNGSTTVDVRTFVSGDSQGTSDWAFNIIVF